MAHALVTGGYGFIGSRLVERLVASGDTVVAFDLGSPPPDWSVSWEVRCVAGDVRDAARLGQAVPRQIDVIYHLAAAVGVDRYLREPADVIDVNVIGTRNVLELAVRTDAKVIFASTSEVFGKNPAVPWREDDDRVLGSTTVDRWSYSSSKALAEHLTFGMAKARDLRATIVRYFNVYGPRQRPAFLISRSVHRALNGKRPVMYDGGTQTRCFTFVDDAVEATVLAATGETDGECFNVGSSTETTVAQAVDLVCELVGGIEAERVTTARLANNGYQDLSRRVPDTTKIHHRLGWRSTTNLRDGTARTIEWARANEWWTALHDSSVL
jgi:dTDP-alpha-D-glucuronic acid decarboxylase